jgi:hypothetical protein
MVSHGNIQPSSQIEKYADFGLTFENGLEYKVRKDENIVDLLVHLFVDVAVFLDSTIDIFYRFFFS